jgi:hypothetical protein
VVGRRSIWSDEEVAALARKFVPAADEVGSLQRKSNASPEAEWFRTVAEQGHYAGRTKPTDTRQGIYAAAPSGVLLASINHNDPRRVAEMLRKALAAWDAMPREKRLPATALEKGSAGGPRWESLYPEGGLVLRVTSRDVGRAEASSDGSRSSDWRASAWNLDFLWFRKDEASRFVPAERTAGARTTVPDALVRRIVRLHLVDDVRGQTPPFPDSAVEKATIESEVVGVKENLVTLRLVGEARVVQRGRWAVEGFRDMNAPVEHERGFDGKFLGRATFDAGTGRFTAFEMVALGSRWGATQYNGRADDPGPAPMGVVFSLASDAPADRVAPAAMWEYGWGPPR